MKEWIVGSPIDSDEIFVCHMTAPIFQARLMDGGKVYIEWASSAPSSGVKNRWKKEVKAIMTGYYETLGTELAVEQSGISTLPADIVSADGEIKPAILTVDHPASSYGRPVMIADWLDGAFGPGDLIETGATKIWPADGMDKNAEHFIAGFVSQLPGLTWCRRCGYMWLSRSLKPNSCPACGSRKWDSIRRENEAGRKPER
jgi:hypothetical protein